jgi:hypothetical protein
MFYVLQVGAALYGPQMLIGLCGAEAVSKTAVSAAQGFLGCAAVRTCTCDPHFRRVSDAGIQVQTLTTMALVLRNRRRVGAFPFTGGCHTLAPQPLACQ